VKKLKKYHGISLLNNFLNFLNDKSDASKEIKSKSDDSGSKARQYLDGLLKIPFGVYRKEPVLGIMDRVRNNFKDLYKKHNIEKIFPEINYKEKYTSVEILKTIKMFQGQTGENDKINQIEKIKEYLTIGDKKKLLSNIKSLDSILKTHNKPRLKYSNLNKEELASYIIEIVDTYIEEENDSDKLIMNDIISEFNCFTKMNPVLNSLIIL